MKLKKAYNPAPEERAQIESKLKDRLAQEPAVQVAYLFGSFVAGGGFNDIDVGVVVDETLDSDGTDGFGFQLEMAVCLEREIRPFPVDVVVLNTAPLPLCFRVVSDGELLVSKDERRRIEFETRTRDLFFDFLPHLDFYYEKLVLGR